MGFAVHVLGDLLARVPPSAWALALLALLASASLQALRWKLLLRDPSIPYRECFAFIGVGASLAMVAPSSLPPLFFQCVGERI